VKQRRKRVRAVQLLMAEDWQGTGLDWIGLDWMDWCCEACGGHLRFTCFCQALAHRRGCEEIADAQPGRSLARPALRQALVISAFA
jgi:hypothetical protein